MPQFSLSFYYLNFRRMRFSAARLIFKSNYILVGLIASIVCFPFSVNALSIDGIVHPESAFTTRDGRIFISEIGGVGKKGDGRILEVFTSGQKKVIASGLNDPKGLLVEGNTIM